MHISARLAPPFLALLVAVEVVAVPCRRVEAASGGCSGATCGTNSPYINLFPFNGLDGSLIKVWKGESICDLDPQKTWTLGIELITEDPRERQDPRPPPLYFRGYQLIVRDSNGNKPELVRDSHRNKSELCDGHLIAGIHFVITARYLHFFSKNYYFVLEQVATTTVTRRITGENNIAELRYAYLITQEKHPGASLCTNSLGQKNIRGKGYALIQPSKDSHDIMEVIPTMRSEYAVILPSPIFDQSGDVIPDDNKRFNIACADNALAETDLSGLVRPEGPPEDRVAAVHMLTAKFRAGRSRTEPGTPIVWRKGALHSSETPEKDEQVIEARWDTKHATCVSHSRLWMQDRVINVSAGFTDDQDPEEKYVETLRDEGVKKCDRCEPGDPCYDVLTSFAVHHIAPHTPSHSSVTTAGPP